MNPCPVARKRERDLHRCAMALGLMEVQRLEGLKENSADVEPKVGGGFQERLE